MDTSSEFLCTNGVYVDETTLLRMIYNPYDPLDRFSLEDFKNPENLNVFSRCYAPTKTIRNEYHIPRIADLLAKVEIVLDTPFSHPNPSIFISFQDSSMRQKYKEYNDKNNVRPFALHPVDEEKRKWVWEGCMPMVFMRHYPLAVFFSFLSDPSDESEQAVQPMDPSFTLYISGRRAHHKLVKQLFGTDPNRLILEGILPLHNRLPLTLEDDIQRRRAALEERKKKEMNRSTTDDTSFQAIQQKLDFIIESLKSLHHKVDGLMEKTDGLTEKTNKIDQNVCSLLQDPIYKINGHRNAGNEKEEDDGKEKEKIDEEDLFSMDRRKLSGKNMHQTTQYAIRSSEYDIRPSESSIKDQSTSQIIKSPTLFTDLNDLPESTLRAEIDTILAHTSKDHPIMGKEIASSITQRFFQRSKLNGGEPSPVNRLLDIYFKEGKVDKKEIKRKNHYWKISP